MKKQLFTLLLAGATLCSLNAGQVLAQSYQISPDSSNTAPGAVQSPTQNAGPVRLARFSYVDGDVSWRPTNTDDWSTAAINIPIREGAQIWVTNGGRAEVQFDDGSYVRIGDGAIVTLQTLYSDENGEFTELGLSQGLATLDLKNKDSIYQLDTPLTSVKAAGPANVRVGVNDGTEVAVHAGSASLTGPGGQATLNDGDYTYIPDSSTPYSISSVPDEDNWDRWNDDRDLALADDETDDHCPPNISLCAGNLDSYGDWRQDPQYGWVWCPRVSDPDWRPYEEGSWVYCEPFGWTWCSSEPWGWAPYHYGTWFHSDDGWAWCPGPARQYWSPAVVSFSYYNGNVGWCPLAPHEVHYSSLDMSNGGNGFFLGFSISQAGCYYPSQGGYCVGRPFSNGYVNRFGRAGFTGRPETITNITNVTNITNITNIHNNFVPENARYGGVMTSSAAGFGGATHYDRGPADATTYFAKGQIVTAPKTGSHTFSGPAEIRPTMASWSPSRAVEAEVQPEPAVVDRQLVRTQLPESVAKVAPPIETITPRRQELVPTSDNDQRQLPTPPDSAASRANEARQSLGFTPINRRQTPPANNQPLNIDRAPDDTERLPAFGGTDQGTERTYTNQPAPSANPPSIDQRPVNRAFEPSPTESRSWNNQGGFQGGRNFPSNPDQNAPQATNSPVNRTYQPAATHVPDWNNQGGFRIDQRNSGGGYTARPVPAMSVPTTHGQATTPKNGHRNALSLGQSNITKQPNQ